MTTDQLPACPFCQAPWTPAMLDEFARFSSSGGCACCHAAHDGEDTPSLPVPERDLCCNACGRAIYRKP